MLLNGIITKDELYRANDREFERLKERFVSKDFQEAVSNFFEQKMLKNKI